MVCFKSYTEHTASYVSVAHELSHMTCLKWWEHAAYGFCLVAHNFWLQLVLAVSRAFRFENPVLLCKMPRKNILMEGSIMKLRHNTGWHNDGRYTCMAKFDMYYCTLEKGWLLHQLCVPDCLTGKLMMLGQAYDQICRQFIDKRIETGHHFQVWCFSS